MKILILYYSYGGNTRKIARMLQKKIGGELAGIETVTPYTGRYSSIVDQGQREVESGFMPEIQPLRVDVKEFDRIILGSPVWWYTIAPAMKTFLSQNDLSGKEIYPFATNGGWIGHIFKDIEASCPGAKVEKGLNIRFHKNELRTPEEEIFAWATRIPAPN